MFNVYFTLTFAMVTVIIIIIYNNVVLVLNVILLLGFDFKKKTHNEYIL